MPKWIKFLIAILLLPVCAGEALAFWKILCSSGAADATWVPLIAGAMCWLVVYLLLPRPMWIYVLGHELTHALWTWLFGGSVKKMKVTAKGGHVIISKTNFLIALAPYFFPLYAVVVIVIFATGNWIWRWQKFFVYFHLLVGAAYAFHITLTAHALKTRQTDITSQGYLFSAVIIFLGNTSVLLFGIPLLTAKISLFEALRDWFFSTEKIIFSLQKLF